MTADLPKPITSVSEFGRTRDLFVWAFAWSRCGKGKRCACGAIFRRTVVEAPKEKR